jgi:hypothetical protein
MTERMGGSYSRTTRVACGMVACTVDQREIRHRQGETEGEHVEGQRGGVELGLSRLELGLVLAEEEVDKR